MRFNVISSGSKGNATIVQNKDTVILIDMGITLTGLKEGLAEFGLDIKDIDAAIFTHDHSDHIKGIKFLSPKIMYALKGTLPTSLSNVVEVNTPFYIKSIKITPVETSHDAINPCGYILEDEKEKLSYITDTGLINRFTQEMLSNPNYLIIESNHDIKMLMATNRPFELKNRILSDVGHLCNEDSALYSLNIIGPRTKEIVLAHLSEEANTPEVALNAYKNIFEHYHVNCKNFLIRCANQHHSLIGGVYEN